jgi:hypothetical protein
MPNSATDESMFDRLVEFVVGLPPERLAAVPLEDLTLCALWCEAYRENEARRAEFERFRALVDAWAKSAAPPAEESEGCRQQPLLRELIELVAQGGVPHMTRDEIDFLVFAWGLAQRASHPELRERPMAKLVPYIRALEERRAQMEPAPGLPSLSKRITLVTAAALKQAEARDFRVFAGIEAPVRGPVFAHRGHLKVVEGIPEDCTVIVEEGNCTVAGMVMGRLASTQSCEILDNVSGVVVARRGGVRARNLVNRCTVIAKEGHVRCTGANEPRLVFAGEKLFVRRSAVHGTYLAREMVVEEELVGGEVQVSARLKAGQCRNTEANTLAIVLRRGLTCRDYGEVLSAESERLLTAAMKLRQRSQMLEAMRAMNEREADDYAGNVLMFLLGEDKTTDQVEKIQRLRAKGAYLERTGHAARALIAAIEDRLSLGGDEDQDPDAPYAPFGPEERALLDEMQQDLMALAAEAPIERSLHDRREEIYTLGQQLFRKLLTRRKILDTLQRLLAAAQAISETHGEVAELIAQREAVLERSMTRIAILERAKAERARVEVMQQLIAASRGRADMATFRDRCANRYVKLVMRNVETRLARVSDYRNAIGALDDQMRKTRAKLWTEYQVSLPEHSLDPGGAAQPVVTARFEAGIDIVAWRHLLESSYRSDPGRLSTEDSGEAVVSYRRSSRGGIQPCPNPDEEAAETAPPPAAH